MTYLKNVVKVIYQRTVEIKKISVESVLEKEDFFSTTLFFQKNRYFPRKLWEIIFGEHDYFLEVGVLWQKLIYLINFFFTN